MSDIQALKQDLIDDAFDTCLNDSGYLASILKSYFDTYPDERIKEMHKDAFEQEPESINICVEVKHGCVQRIYGEDLPDGVEINFIVRDVDAIEEGYVDPLPRNFEPVTTYW